VWSYRRKPTIETGTEEQVVSWKILILQQIELALCTRSKKYAKHVAALKKNDGLLISAIAGYVAKSAGIAVVVAAALAAAMLRASSHGHPIAIKAMAAKLARLVYRMLRYGMKYVDQGAAFYEAQHKQSQMQLKWKAAKLGYKVTPIPAAA
jgi:hypothetical protein